jgi:hypothetical protein
MTTLAQSGDRMRSASCGTVRILRPLCGPRDSPAYDVLSLYFKIARGCLRGSSLLPSAQPSSIRSYCKPSHCHLMRTPTPLGLIGDGLTSKCIDPMTPFRYALTSACAVNRRTPATAHRARSGWREIRSVRCRAARSANVASAYGGYARAGTSARRGCAPAPALSVVMAAVLAAVTPNGTRPYATRQGPGR